MNETLYERYAKIRDLKGFTDYKVANITEIGTPTISNWKKGKYTPKEDKLRKIAACLDVTYEYMIGKTDMVVCPVCGFGDNPLSEQSRKEHEEFHNRFLLAKEKYSFLMNYSEATTTRTDSIIKFRDSNGTLLEKMYYYEEYLKSSFSLEIAKRNYDTNLDYDDFCKTEVASLKPDWQISKDTIELLVETYGVNKDFSNENEQLLARTSNNAQLMRLLAYAEKLNPKTLDSIEIQLKALAENEG